MELLHEILSWVSSFSIIICSLCWIACSWMCLQTHKSISQRIRIFEDLVLATAEKVSKMEFKQLMDKIEGKPTNGDLKNESH